VSRVPAARLLLVAALLAGTAGCKRRCWYEWRDEPYVRPVFLKGERAALARMGSGWADDREIGCRALGVLAREARRRGDEAAARRMARKLMEHFETESNPETRSIILVLCLREAGREDAEVHAFLKSRLNSGEHPVAAAYSLASLRPDGAFEALSSALTRARDCGLRYELLGALWLLGDRRALPLLEGALEEIDAEWPERVRGTPRAECRRALAGRIETLRAACAAEAGR
jgi:hypothetical protein